MQSEACQSTDSQPQRRRWYLSPYHESPVDLDKYEAEMKASTKSNGKDACWADKSAQNETSKTNKTVKQKKNGKSVRRPLATGCAANFKDFGGNENGSEMGA